MPTDHIPDLTLDSHTDLIPDDPNLRTWRFDVKTLEAHYSPSYTNPIVRALLTTLSTLPKQQSESLGKLRPVFWLREIQGRYIVGTSTKAFKILDSILDEAFRTIEGYKGSRKKPSSSKHLAPRFGYREGKVVGYLEPELVGQTVVDGEDRYGSGVKVEYRKALPKDGFYDMMRCRRFRV